MKRFTKTKFFRLLKDEKGIQLPVLAKTYDDFAEALFAATIAAKDKLFYHNVLCYTRAELTSLQKSGGLEKKCANSPLFGQGY